MGCCCTEVAQQNRTIHFHRQNNPTLKPNLVETTKYTWYTFLPKAILIQFVRPANFVYLLSAILQSIDVISSLTPITAIAPFVFVMGISLIREGFEDYRRYKTDQEINHRPTQRLINQAFYHIKWEQVMVGDIIKIRNNETIPADILLLHTSEQNSLCYVETANLDGQSNLKAKYAHVDSIKCYPQQFEKIKGSLLTDAPNSDLHSFSGYLQLPQKQEKHIDFENIILRQTVLKNTDQVVGVVVYAGYDTKIVQNQGKIQNKVSNVEKKVNIIQFVLLIVLFILAASCSIGFHYAHNVHHEREGLYYLFPMSTPHQTQSLLIYFSSFLLLTFLIPISLNVSIEVIKAFLGIFLNFDDKMYYASIDKRCNVNNFSIIEELGKIDYVLTDKTGTLTANQMVFKHLVIGNNSYTADYLHQNYQILKNNPQFHHFWLGVLICHDVVCEPETQQYQGSSPDEVCFIEYARTIGYRFMKRTKNSIEMNVHGQKVVYQLLEMISFSPRKRMTVVVKNLNTMKIESYTKGADSAVFSKAQPSPFETSIKHGIDQFAKEGFRTLLFSYRQFTAIEYEAFREEKNKLKAQKIQKSITKEQADERENIWIQKIESDLIIMGATGIQDRLQDEVPETIARLQQADIKVMMITGDKLETAENIGYLANFIKIDAIVVRITQLLMNEEIIEMLEDVQEQKFKNSNSNFSLIIEGQAIQKFLGCQGLNLIEQTLTNISSIIFCRSSPKEKANIVQFVKKNLKGLVLAIGDGGNDVGMIQVANVGVGILGKQGNSASVVSDFSIAQFKYLDRLVLHHGRWFYYRLSYFFVYYGWKNLMMTLVLYFFMIDSAFSALAGLSDPFIAIYNIIIGLCLVVYYAIFEQDINDDQYPPAYRKLPIFYKEIKERDLFSYKRYIIWTLFSIVIAIFIFVSAKFSLGSINSIGENGQPGDFGHQAEQFALCLTFISVMVLIMDIKMYTWFSTLFVIIFLTIIGCVLFFLIENFVDISVNIYTLNILSRTTFRFWAVVFLNIGVVYGGKLLIDTVYYEKYPSEIDKTIEEMKDNQGLQKLFPILEHTRSNLSR